MKYTNLLPLMLFFSIILIACGETTQSTTTSKEEQPNQKETPKAEDWIVLFDGTDASGWRSFNGTKLPEGWVVEEGTLKSLGKGGDIGGDIVYGKQEFANFELMMDWKISEGGNSGIFYHVQEGEQYAAPYQNAPEYQVLDDIGFPEPLEDWQQVGADYAMYPANPEKKIVKKAGEWNSTKIVFTPEKVEHWLNGQKIVEFVPWTEEWNQKKATSKWKDYPDYGVAKTGLIGLQDHGSFIWYKNIKIKEL